MDFGKCRMGWMEECVFTSIFFVLVNSSPTKNFKVGRGLRKMNSLSPFLFLLVVEGLTCLVNKVVSVGDYLPFKVNKDIQFDILKFSNDTTLLGEVSWSNLWSIKGFFMGLRVNIRFECQFFEE